SADYASQYRAPYHAQQNEEELEGEGAGRKSDQRRVKAHLWVGTAPRLGAQESHDPQAETHVAAEVADVCQRGVRRRGVQREPVVSPHCLAEQDREAPGPHPEPRALRGASPEASPGDAAADGGVE